MHLKPVYNLKLMYSPVLYSLVLHKLWLWLSLRLGINQEYPPPSTLCLKSKIDCTKIIKVWPNLLNSSTCVAPKTEASLSTWLPAGSSWLQLPPLPLSIWLSPLSIWLSPSVCACSRNMAGALPALSARCLPRLS